MPKIPISKHKEDIEKFKTRENDYKQYARVLEEVLKKALDIYAPLGVVQARAKQIASFSEKIIRKDKYKDPLLDMTDLCGARAIVHFESQVVTICKFIRENFEIDDANSIDVKTRLNVGEFGYRSVHYIVTPSSSEILGVTIPENIKDLKAEIQIRTFNEHVWADILHDRIYKTRINVPKKWQRESARLAALLEEVDNSFVKISETLDRFSVNYRPTPDVAKLENEIFVLKTLIEINSDINDKTIETQLKLAVIYNLEGKWDEIISLLGPILSMINKLKRKDYISRLMYELGYALCIKNKKEPESGDFNRGKQLIEESIHLLADEYIYSLDISKANFLLARICAIEGSSKDVISSLLARARKYSFDNPYYMLYAIAEKLGSEVHPLKVTDDFTLSLREIISKCKEHIEIGIETVDAHIAIAICYWLLGEENEGIRTLISLIQLVRLERIPCSEDSFNWGIDLLDLICPPEKTSVLSAILHLACWRKFRNNEAKDNLEKYHDNEVSITGNVLILAGNSGSMELNQKKEYETYLRNALGDFEGTVISGGTSTGLPGIVGTLTDELRHSGRVGYDLFGYCPAILPGNVKVGEGYDRIITSETGIFSFLDAFKYWTDILFCDVPLNRILVLGINGKTISELEYSFALSLGVNVALIDKSGGAAEKIIQDPGWAREPNLMVIPEDPDTIWALANQNRKISFTPQETIMLAEDVHNFYRQERLNTLKPDTQNIDDLKVVMPWDKLDPKLITSNLKQVEFYEHLLNQAGLTIQKTDNPRIYRLDETFKDIDRLAQLEHARWNAERLLSGWRYGPVKDINKKLNPSIVKWDDLSPEIRKYDYDPIRNIPALLAKIGYEIVELK